MAYELIAAGAGLGLGAWFVMAADAGDRARVGVLLFRRHRGQP